MDRCLRSCTDINVHGAMPYCGSHPEVHLCAGHLCAIPAPEWDKWLLLSHCVAGMEHVACTEDCQPGQVLATQQHRGR